MARASTLAFVLALAWLTVPAAQACPLCYGGDEPATGRATLWAAVVLVGAVYGLLAAGSWWVVLRLRRQRAEAGSET